MVESHKNAQTEGKLGDSKRKRAIQDAVKHLGRHKMIPLSVLLDVDGVAGSMLNLK